MKKVHLFLFIIFLSSIAAKVNFSPNKQIPYAVLSTDIKAEAIENFYRYKVNQMQFEPVYKMRSCSVKSSGSCCQV